VVELNYPGQLSAAAQELGPRGTDHLRSGVRRSPVSRPPRSR